MRAVNFSLTILAPVGHPDRIDSLRDGVRIEPELGHAAITALRIADDGRNDLAGEEMRVTAGLTRKMLRLLSAIMMA